MASERIDHLLDHAADLVNAGRGVMLCVLVRARGSTPAPEGAVMLVDDGAGLRGTIGGGCVEAEVRRRVTERLARGESARMAFRLDHDYGWDDGLICGGQIDVAAMPLVEPDPLRAAAARVRRREPAEIEVIVRDDPADPVDTSTADPGRLRYVLDLPPRPRLFVAGAGHIGQALCRFALDLDFEVHVFDDRADLLERFVPDPARRVAGPIEERITEAGVDPATYVVVATRGHRHDERVLGAVAESPAAYIGMIGSRRKVKLIFDDLVEAGVDESALARVHAPVGLPIGSITVHEIGLSIAAQLVEHRRSDHRSPVRGPEAAPEVVVPGSHVRRVAAPS